MWYGAPMTATSASPDTTSDASATATSADPQAAAPPPEAAKESAPDDDGEELEPAADGPPPVPTGKPPRPSAAPAAASSDEEPLSVTGHLPAAVWPPTTVADLMTRQVITLKQDEPIGDLEGWMSRFRFRHLPVVDASMKLVGLISRTDLLHACLGVGPAGGPIEKATPETLAGAIMRRGVVTAQPDAALVTACRVMLHEKLGCLPIILEDTTLVGIVTESDFTRLSLELLERKG